MNITRNITLKAQKYLDFDEILLFIGPRQAGKTFILKQIQDVLKTKSQLTHFINLEDSEYRDLLNNSPKNLFKIFSFDPNKKNFVFIDEVQYLSDPSNFLKYLYDEYRSKIKLIVSGSSAFYIDKKFKDSLAGRKKIFNVLTLSFREFLRFKGENALSTKDFDNVSLDEKEKLTLFYNEYIVYGGYPRVVLAPRDEKKEILMELAYSYIKKDIFESNLRQEEIFYKLLKILSSQVGNLVNGSELANTLNVSKTTIDNYLYVMQKSFHLKLIPPLFGNVRKELTKMPKVFFLDLGLRNFFVDNFNNFLTRADKGALLENAVFRQLLEKYNGEEIRFWRTINKDEVDFVISEKKAIEVKVDPERFQKKNYKVFLDHYKNIEFSIACLESEKNKIGDYSVIEAWKI